MDPFTALGAAANIIQFVSFAAALISQTKEVSCSAAGCSMKAATLEASYDRLKTLSNELATVSFNPPAIRDLWLACKNDCDRLLGTLQRLRSSNKPNKTWKSFTVALRTVWKASEISDLEDRLRRTQSVLTLHICANIR